MMDPEDRLIGNLVISPNEIIKTKEIINYTRFQNRKNKAVYKALTLLTKEKKPNDMVSLIDFLEKNTKEEWKTYILDITNVEYENVVTLSKKVFEIWYKKEIYAKMQPVLKLLSDNYGDPFEAVNQLNETLNNLNELKPRQNKSNKDITRKHYQLIQTDRTKNFLPFFLPKFNHQFLGIEKRKYCVIGARPSAGKTALLVSQSNYLSTKGFKSVVFSLETPDISLLDRYVILNTSIDMMRLKSSKLDNMQKQELFKFYNSFEKSNIKIIDDIFHIEDIEDYVINNIDNIDCIFIDYIQIVNSYKSHESKRVQVGYISSVLRRLTLKYDMAIIALAQLNRESEQSKTPSLRDLKEAGNLEQDADIVMLLDRKKNQYGNFVEDCNIIIAKNKEFGFGNIETYFKANKMSFVERVNEMEIAA